MVPSLRLSFMTLVFAASSGCVWYVETYDPDPGRGDGPGDVPDRGEDQWEDTGDYVDWDATRSPCCPGGEDVKVMVMTEEAPVVGARILVHDLEGIFDHQVFTDSRGIATIKSACEPLLLVWVARDSDQLDTADGYDGLRVLSGVEPGDFVFMGYDPTE